MIPTGQFFQFFIFYDLRWVRKTNCGKFIFHDVVSCKKSKKMFRHSSSSKRPRWWPMHRGRQRKAVVSTRSAGPTRPGSEWGQEWWRRRAPTRSGPSWALSGWHCARQRRGAWAVVEVRGTSSIDGVVGRAVASRLSFEAAAAPPGMRPRDTRDSSYIVLFVFNPLAILPSPYFLNHTMA